MENQTITLLSPAPIQYLLPKLSFKKNHRFSDYTDALCHLLSTGQGVVLERSPYSDIVFLEALYKCGFITKQSYKGLLEVRGNSLCELLRPHLVIYLDVPVNKTLVSSMLKFRHRIYFFTKMCILQENIKKRNLNNEANAPLFKDTKFLETLDNEYKHNFLRDISAHSELLVYDWSNGGDIELVVEDIERIGEYQYHFENVDIIE